MVDRSPAGVSLVSLRRDLEEIDRAIVVLVAARIGAACRAIRLRSQLDGHIENVEQEARVLARAQAWGRPLGLAPKLTETLFRAMIESGKERFAAGVPPAGLGKLSRARSRSRPRATPRLPSPTAVRFAAPTPP